MRKYYYMKFSHDQGESFRVIPIWFFTSIAKAIRKEILDLEKSKTGVFLEDIHAI